MENSKDYEFILFDADKTLFDFDYAEEKALEISLTNIGLIYRKAIHLERYRFYNHKAWSDFEKGLTTPDKLKVKRFAEFFGELGIDTNIEQFSEMYLDELSQITRFLPGAEDLLQKLHGKVKMVILTNGLKKVQRRRFSKDWVMQYFDDVIISEEIGCAKPCNEIFDAAFGAVNHTDKNTALMVGDNLSSDIQGGINYGIDTCWFNPTKQNGNNEIQPTYEIVELEQIEDILITV